MAALDAILGQYSALVAAEDGAASSSSGAASGPGAVYELEMRLRNLGEPSQFATLAAAVRRGAGEGDGAGAVTRTVEIVVPVGPRETHARLRGDGAPRGGPGGALVRTGRPPASRRFVQEFDAAGAKSAPLRAEVKESLASHTAAVAGAPFRLALSREAPLPGAGAGPPALPPLVGEGTIVRVKLRAQYPAAALGPAGAGWRFDLTAVAELAGAAAAERVRAEGPAPVAPRPSGVGAGAPGAETRLKALKDLLLGAAGPEAAAADEALGAAAARLGAPLRFEAELELEPGAEPPADAEALRALAAAAHGLRDPAGRAAAAHRARVAAVARALAVPGPRVALFARGELGLKRLLPQARNFTRQMYAEAYPPAGFFVTAKADGFRAVLLAGEGDASLVADAGVAETPGAGRFRAGAVVLDGEFVPEGGAEAGDGLFDPDFAGNAAGTFYAFDAIAAPTQRAGGDAGAGGSGEAAGVAARPFRERLAAAAAAVAGGALDARLVLPGGGTLALRVVLKRFEPLAGGAPAELEAAIRAVAEGPLEDSGAAPRKAGAGRASGSAGRPRPATDGLVFVKDGAPYLATENLKWKPLESVTIDFLARRAPAAAVRELADAARAGAAAAGPEPAADAGADTYFLFLRGGADLRERLGLPVPPGYGEMFPEAAGGAGAGGAWAIPPGATVPVQFSPGSAPLAYVYAHPRDSPLGADVDGAILEMRCAGGCVFGGRPAWEAVRRRREREAAAAREGKPLVAYANDYRVGEETWSDYLDPLPFEDLWRGPGGGYFRAAKAGGFAAATAFNSYAKAVAMHAAFAAPPGRGAAGRRDGAGRRAEVVVDVAAGQGADLGRHFKEGVRLLYAVDADAPALVTLLKRRFSHAGVGGDRGRGRGDRGGPGRDGRDGRDGRGGTRVVALKVDATDFDALVAEVRGAPWFPAEGADAVVCNFALHYLAPDREALAGFLAAARRLLRPGGRLLVVFLVGEAVAALFEREGVAVNGAWRVDAADGRPLYEVTRLYDDAGPPSGAGGSDAGSAETVTGRPIALRLPFTGDEQYRESLVARADVAALAPSAGLEPRAHVSFASLLGSWDGASAARDGGDARPRGPQLSEADRTFVSLYGYTVLDAV